MIIGYFIRKKIKKNPIFFGAIYLYLVFMSISATIAYGFYNQEFYNQSIAVQAEVIENISRNHKKNAMKQKFAFKPKMVLLLKAFPKTQCAIS